MKSLHSGQVFLWIISELFNGNRWTTILHFQSALHGLSPSIFHSITALQIILSMICTGGRDTVKWIVKHPNNQAWLLILNNTLMTLVGINLDQSFSTKDYCRDLFSLCVCVCVCVCDCFYLISFKHSKPHFFLYCTSWGQGCLVV